jgi:hypothetical protein
MDEKNYSREQCVIHCIRPQKLKRGKTSFTLKIHEKTQVVISLTMKLECDPENVQETDTSI